MFKYAFQKDIGGREDQQDNVKILKKENIIFIVLGDGMGGHSGGSFASKTLIETASYFFENNFRKNNINEFFNQIIKETVKKLTIYAQETGEDPRTTTAFALIIENEIHFANIGDSRIYLFEKDKLITRSRDHSVPEMLFQIGEIKEEDMANHPDQNKLLKSVGPNSQDIPTYNKYIFEKDKEFGILACSDGLWEYVTEDEMRNFVFKDSPEEAVAKMIMIAKKRGGERGDNISVAIVRKYSNKIQEIEKKEDLKEHIQKKENKFVLLFILFLFLLAIGGGYGFYKLKQKSNNKAKTTNKSIKPDKAKTTNKSTKPDKAKTTNKSTKPDKAKTKIINTK